jgi:CBS domain-containing protein
MCTIRELIKDQETFFAEPNQSVMEVARAMVERNIGAVPILRGRELAGIFSERDLLKRVVAEGRDPQTTKVGEVMTENPLVVSPNEELANCLVLMRNHGFRHLPICQGRELKGVVSLRDILLRDLTEKDDEVRMMRAYIHGT